PDDTIDGRSAQRPAVLFLCATATSDIYPLSLHDALPICRPEPPAPPREKHDTIQDERRRGGMVRRRPGRTSSLRAPPCALVLNRSEEHTSELQSREKLVCRLLLEKKNTQRSTQKCSPLHR